jgi:hypothetical protein
LGGKLGSRLRSRLVGSLGSRLGSRLVGRFIFLSFVLKCLQILAVSMEYILVVLDNNFNYLI